MDASLTAMKIFQNALMRRGALNSCATRELSSTQEAAASALQYVFGENKKSSAVNA